MINKYYAMIAIMVICLMGTESCRRTGVNHPEVQNAIDTIIMKSHRSHSMFDVVYMDEYDYSNERRQQWHYGDSIDKYCSDEELEELARHHENNVIRIVAFHYLMKRNPHQGVQVVIDDINNNDSLSAYRGDRGCYEAISSIRVWMIQWDRQRYKVSLEDSIAIDKAVLSSRIRSEISYSNRLLKE